MNTWSSITITHTTQTLRGAHESYSGPSMTVPWPKYWRSLPHSPRDLGSADLVPVDVEPISKITFNSTIKSTSILKERRCTYFGMICSVIYWVWDCRLQSKLFSFFRSYWIGVLPHLSHEFGSRIVNLRRWIETYTVQYGWCKYMQIQCKGWKIKNPP
jgi:hypothetical protein